MTKQDLFKQIEQWKPRSAWDKGVKGLMFMLAYDAIEQRKTNIELDDLINIVNRPQDLHECARLLSYGGMLLIWDCEIAELLCTPSELRRNKHGELKPNRHENWCDVQARACYKALRRLQAIIKNLNR